MNEIKCDPNGFNWAKPKKHRNIWSEDTGNDGSAANLEDYASVTDVSL